MPQLEDFLNYAGIDYADDVVNANATRALNAARRILLGSIGDDVEQYLPGDERITELVLIYASDLYSESGVSAKVSGSTRRLVFDMEQQLRLELATAKAAAAEEVAKA